MRYYGITSLEGGEIMPRQARTQSLTEYYHVMMRGNNRENIIIRLRQNWLSRLGIIIGAATMSMQRKILS